MKKKKNYAEEAAVNSAKDNTGLINTIVTGAGGVLSGIANMIGSIKGTNPDTNIYYSNPDSGNNKTGLYVAIGGVVVVLVVVMVFAFKK